MGGFRDQSFAIDLYSQGWNGSLRYLEDSLSSDTSDCCCFKRMMVCSHSLAATVSETV